MKKPVCQGNGPGKGGFNAGIAAKKERYYAIREPGFKKQVG